jgi:hypothetical protein
MTEQQMHQMQVHIRLLEQQKASHVTALKRLRKFFRYVQQNHPLLLEDFARVQAMRKKFGLKELEEA